MLGQGHRRIGFIGGPPSHSASKDRFEGFCAALRDYQLELSEALVQPGNFDFQSGWRAANMLLDLQPRPTAVFATSDDMAAAVVSCALHRNIQVPKQLSVVGFDDTPLATRVWPAITTVRQPVVEMATMAVKALVAAVRAGEGRGDKAIELPFELIERETTAAPVV